MLLTNLLSPRVPLWQYCLVAFPLALIPSATLFACAYGILLVLGEDVSSLLPPARTAAFGEVIGTILVAPIAETLLLALGLRLLLRFMSRPLVAAIASAVLWGALHAALAPLWFFGTAWSFFVFSCAYLGWQPRSFGHAFTAAAVPHALINFSAMMSIIIENAV